MSFNRGRNIFTLGDFSTQLKVHHSRRQNSDPFERDPFKIQSYNFRYAERPQLPLPSHSQPQSNHCNNQSNDKRFDTYFYNHDFSNNRHNKENPPSCSFHAYRRRKFIQDQSTAATNIFSVHQEHQEVPYRGRYYHCGSNATTATINGGSTNIANNCSNNNTNNGSTLQWHQNRYQQYSNITQQRNPFQTPSASCSYLRSSTVPFQQQQGTHVSRNTISNVENLSPLHPIGSNGSAYSFQHPYNVQQQQLLRKRLQTQQQQQQQNSGVSRGPSPKRSNYLGSSSSHSLFECRSSCGRRLSQDVINTGACSSGGCGSNNGVRIFIRDQGGNGRENQRNYDFTDEPFNRRSLHALHISTSKNVVNKRGSSSSNGSNHNMCSYSGCEININIKGLDDNELGENLTIKIEKPDYNNSSNNITNPYVVKRERDSSTDSRKKLNTMVTQTPKRSTSAERRSGNLNVLNKKSTESIKIDKHISKFALNNRYGCGERTARGREREPEAVREKRSFMHNTLLSPAAERDCRQLLAATRLKPAMARPISPGLLPNASNRQPSVERTPSIVPWNLDIRTQAKKSTERPQRRSRLLPPYATINLSDLKRTITPFLSVPPQHCNRSSRPSTTQATTTTTPSRVRRASERAIFNCVNETQSKKVALRPPLPIRKSNSYHALPTPILPSRSLTSGRGGELNHSTTALSLIRSNQTASGKLPLNVNINVYADKLKMLRV